MNESDPLPPFQSIPLPKLFQPFLEDHPFEHCLVCECDLLQDDLHYLIEKAYQGTEVIFEYALCVSCAMAMRAELSPESLQRMQDQFENSQNLEARRTRLAKLPTREIEPWIDTCVITGTSRHETDSYQLCAHCVGRELVLTDLPFMISAAAMNEMSALLSKKTRDSLDDFTDQYLGLPPELREVFDDLPVLIF